MNSWPWSPIRYTFRRTHFSLNNGNNSWRGASLIPTKGWEVLPFGVNDVNGIQSFLRIGNQRAWLPPIPSPPQGVLKEELCSQGANQANRVRTGGCPEQRWMRKRRPSNWTKTWKMRDKICWARWNKMRNLRGKIEGFWRLKLRPSSERRIKGRTMHCIYKYVPCVYLYTGYINIYRFSITKNH